MILCFDIRGIAVGVGLLFFFIGFRYYSVSQVNSDLTWRACLRAALSRFLCVFCLMQAEPAVWHWHHRCQRTRR
jgi:hypothetical protein